MLRRLVFLIALLALAVPAAGEGSSLVAQISTVSYDDSLDKGGLSFETKDGADVLRRRLLLSSDGKVGINLPDGRDPTAMLHLEGDLIALNGTVENFDVLEALNVHNTLVAANVSAERLSISESCSAKALKVSGNLSAGSVDTEALSAGSASIAAKLSAQTIVAERISASGMINATIVNATEFVATRLSAAGISINGVWAAHQDRFCSPIQSSLAVPSAASPGECIAACMGDADCQAVTFYATPPAGVDHQCYRAEQCGATSRPSSVGAVVHEKPPVALLDMAAELNAAKAPPYS
ncbi:hypothetical protein T484DRAFT_2027446 [Baffinella frigidus]|nr:hypothetical protein T484DRAFT_2027446 [Cryptophyta sp. CCMP2293]